MTVLTGNKQTKKNPVSVLEPSALLCHLELEQCLQSPSFVFWVSGHSGSPVMPLCLLSIRWVISCWFPAQKTANEHSIKMHSSSAHWECSLHYHLGNDAFCSLYSTKAWYISFVYNKSIKSWQLAAFGTRPRNYSGDHKTEKIYIKNSLIQTSSIPNLWSNMAG